jgi:uncharacterized membrane protein
MIATIGRYIYAFAIVAVGVETWVIARQVGHALGPQYDVLNVLPWLPANPWVAYVFGAIWIYCGVGLLFERTVRIAALVLGSLLFLCAVILEAPKNAVAIGDVSLRTTVFEPLAIACLAWLIPGRGAVPSWLERGGRYLLALSLVIFGVDHFFVLSFIATLIPAWIPWHMFWSGFFGVAFIAGGLSIGFNVMQRFGAIGIGLMFAIWVFTLHIPRVLGLYGIPGAPTNPDEWSSLFIAVALWGGPWAMARRD